MTSFDDAYCSETDEIPLEIDRQEWDNMVSDCNALRADLAQARERFVGLAAEHMREPGDTDAEARQRAEDWTRQHESWEGAGRALLAERDALKVERDAAKEREQQEHMGWTGDRARLAAAQARIAEAPQVECACHPGVRWPVEGWGKPCPITKAEAHAERLAEALDECEEWFDQRADVDVQGDPPAQVPNSEMHMLQLVRTALSAWADRGKK